MTICSLFAAGPTDHVLVTICSLVCAFPMAGVAWRPFTIDAELLYPANTGKTFAEDFVDLASQIVGGDKILGLVIERDEGSHFLG